mmetsp:Transcript_83838/g.270975  ORF Transcript_83838/g.270975 Transcript_83838/m.270975 type:complete len:143 (-) Transcript_83838:54-482(-)
MFSGLLGSGGATAGAAGVAVCRNRRLVLDLQVLARRLAEAPTSPSASSSSFASPLQQQRRFARDPLDGSLAKLKGGSVQEFRADKDRLRDGWAWVGWWEACLEKQKHKAKKVRRKLQFPSECPLGRATRQEQRAYWNKEAAK